MGIEVTDFTVFRTPSLNMAITISDPRTVLPRVFLTRTLEITNKRTCCLLTNLTSVERLSPSTIQVNINPFSTTCAWSCAIAQLYWLMLYVMDTLKRHQVRAASPAEILEEV